jgi:hypothetical protein
MRAERYHSKMAKNFLLPLSIAVIGLMFPFFGPTPFTLRVVDEHTGVGVPNLRVTDKAGMVRHTGAHGELIVWSKTLPQSMGDRFEISDENREFVNIGATLKVAPGEQATLKVRRRTYR